MRPRFHSRFISATIALFAAGFTPFTALAGDANPVQTKYITHEGAQGVMCKPTGTLKELTSGEFKCYGPAGGEKCGAILEAAKGTLKKPYIDLFGDLVKKDASGFLYSQGCKDMNGADFAEYVAIAGIGYAKATEHLGALLTLASAENLAAMGADPRANLIASFGRFGDASKAKILPALKTALSTKGSALEFKQNALNLMVRYGSDDGVAYCTDVLKQGNDKTMTKTCSWYLAERKAPGVAEVLVRGYESERKFFARALGLLGGKEGVEVLKAAYEKSAGSSVVLPETVALLNLGDKSHDYQADLVAMIQGRRPLSIKDRAKKAEELAAGKKGAEDRWKKREAEEKEDVASEAAIEATYVLNPASAKAVDDALALTSKHSGWNKASARAASARAQLGNKAGVSDLVALLSSPNKDARDIAVNAFGAKYNVPEAFLEYVGRKGAASDASVPAALVKFIESESNEEARLRAIIALGTVRSFL